MKLERENGREAAYLSLVDDGDERTVALTIEVQAEGPGLFLDFDAEGYLIGIEFLGPTVQLRPATLSQAQIT